MPAAGGDEIQRKLQALIENAQFAFHFIPPETPELGFQFAFLHGNRLKQELNGFLLETRTHRGVENSTPCASEFRTFSPDGPPLCA